MDTITAYLPYSILMIKLNDLVIETWYKAEMFQDPDPACVTKY